MTDKDVRHINIPIFIPHLGCPNKCVFCDQHRISGAMAPVGISTVKETIEKYLASSSGGNYVEIAFFGGSFTGIPRSQMIAYLEAAKEYLDKGCVKNIRVSTRPDYIDRGILDILRKYGVGIIELGVQSMDDVVLAMSRRGHTSDDVVKAVGLIREYGIECGIQIMPGLPGDTLEKSLQTSRKVIELAPDMVRIYPAVVLRGTEMEDMYRSGTFRPLTVDEAVEWCARIVPMFRKAGIRIIRIGLHYSELLESSVVAGPFHPALGEMVEARVILDRIMDLIEKNGLEKCSSIEIRTWRGALSKTVGQKKANIRALKERYGYRTVKVTEAGLPEGGLQVSCISGREYQ